MGKLPFLFLAILLSACFHVSAHPQAVLAAESAQRYIGRNISVLKDSCGCLNIQDVVRKHDEFVLSGKDVINLGVSDDIHWLHVSIQNNTANDKLVLNVSYPIIYHVGLYIVHDNGSIDSTLIYASKLLAERDYNHQFYIFDIPVKSGDYVNCYLKIHGPGQIVAPVSVGTDTTIMKAVSDFDTLSGLYFGIMMVMFLYNLFVYFSVRDRSYLLYVAYIFWVTLTQATLQGFGQRFLWADFPWMTRYMVTLTGAIVGIATVVFVMGFLHTKRNTPRLHSFLFLIIFGDLAAIVALFLKEFNISYHLVNITAMLGSVFVVSVAVKLFRQGYRPAKFFLIAWTVFLVSVIIFVLKDYGIIPYNLFTSHSLQFGSAFEAILLSFALADSINTLKMEKELSQAQALEVSLENERIIREQNVILESKVNERTVELQASNAELERTLYDLQEKETQLVESEKMASLGQLTAGIAHEINNPINFVTSNVNPLKRDVGLLVTMVGQIEELSLLNIPAEEKQRQIEELKNDLDYDYLKTEIDYLLQGISDGASRTAEIVKGLRVFSRLDEDDLKKADVNEGLSSSLVIVNHLLNNVIEVEKKYSGIPMVECYPGKLNQVFLNMMSNSIHAIHKRWDGNPGGKLVIRTWNDELNVYISVMDNGTGMDENTRKKLFEPFFTTKDVGEGTGLGLSIAYNTIRKHNGTIEVKSEVGEGTELIITLPINHSN
jgi:signal transduction histidine kinase